MTIRRFWILALGAAVLTGVPLAAAAEDRDGDGHAATRAGGDDCDDRDGSRYPGNTEVCDDRDHDEDCNPMTFGHRDEDGDGEVDVRCCNRTPSGLRTCGTDCDDANRAIQPASQICDGDAVAICGPGGRYERVGCTTGTVCVTQPNGTGVCMVRPPGYVAAPAFRPARATRLPPPPPPSPSTQLAPPTQPVPHPAKRPPPIQKVR